MTLVRKSLVGFLGSECWAKDFKLLLATSDTEHLGDDHEHQAPRYIVRCPRHAYVSHNVRHGGPLQVTNTVDRIETTINP